ncbi:MAG: UvrD-helicase domain-containing protein [Nocardioidaceae bacterium]
MPRRQEMAGQLALPEPLLRDEEQLCDVMGVPFSAEQLEAITAPLDPMVVVAGAGSGKTSVMTARVVWLVGTGQVEPGQVLGLTFTNKAAAELGARVRSALRRLARAAEHPALLDEPGLDEQGEPTVSTYHAYAGGLIVEHGLRLGFEPDLRLVEDATRFQLAARAVAAYPGLLPDLPSHLPTLVRDVIELDNQLLDHLVDLEAVRAFDDELRKLLERRRPLKDVLRAVDASRGRDQLLDLVAAYRTAKTGAGAIEFADQMARGARLAIECPEVAATERDRYRVVLLDEYQDTSVSQRRMLQGLFSGDSPGGGLGHPVTAVGDPCQGIYGWRGASVDNIDDFPVHFPRADGEPAVRRRLGVNRRCAVRVLDAANDVADNLYAVHRGAEPLGSREAAAEGRVRLAVHETVIDEIDWIADQVRALPRELADAGRHAPWSDIAVLVRDRNEIAELSAALRVWGVPVEVVGLAGLLIQPEVTDVVATLHAVSDLTANAAVLRLLSGPRWRIGVRDLALLGKRAGQLAQAVRRERHGLNDTLDAAVSGIDPTEIMSLSEALADPGDLAYSDAARERFAALAAELTMLRRHAGEPLVELTRRVVDTLGLDVELATRSGPEAEQARDNLALFVETVADFAAGEPRASLPALLAYLEAEAVFNRGIELATPTAADSVKLLTVHAAKGLEWRAVVVPFLADGVFPSSQGRPRWPWVPSEVPGPLRGDAGSLPSLASWDTVGFRAYAEANRAAALLEEQRLGYVAITRAKEVLVASAHWWGRTQTRPRGPSSLWRQLADHATDPIEPEVEPPADGAANPVLVNHTAVAFPGRLDEPRLEQRRRAAAEVRAAMRSDADPPAVDPTDLGESDREVLAALARIDGEIEPLLAEAAAAATDHRVEVDLPASLSATTVQRLRDDPDRLARELARPMPRLPSAAARFGTRFHAWVEAHFGQQSLWDPTDLPGRADSDIDDDADLTELIEAFRAGPFGDRPPHAVEAPFALLLGGQVVRGRIDAVYVTDDGFEVVDWKTNRTQDADPLQLALYRLAWAEMHDLPLERVGAAFYYVRTGDLVRPDDLADRAALERLVTGAG